MVNTIGAIALSLAALVPAPDGAKEAHKPPLHDGTVIVRLTPHRTAPADGNYVVEGTDAQSRYEELKAALDEKFAHMFRLKEALDRAQSEMSKKWDEYYTLHEKYNRELKKIIAAWVTESDYLAEK